MSLIPQTALPLRQSYSEGIPRCDNRFTGGCALAITTLVFMSWSSVKTSSLVIVADAAIVYNIQQTLHTSRVGALARLLVTCAVVQWAAGLFNIDARIASNKFSNAAVKRTTNLFESMENHWRNTIFNVAVNDSDNQRSKRQPTILKQLI